MVHLYGRTCISAHVRAPCHPPERGGDATASGGGAQLAAEYFEILAYARAGLFRAATGCAVLAARPLHGNTSASRAGCVLDEGRDHDRRARTCNGRCRRSRSSRRGSRRSSRRSGRNRRSSSSVSHRRRRSRAGRTRSECADAETEARDQTAREAGAHDTDAETGARGQTA